MYKSRDWDKVVVVRRRMELLRERELAGLVFMNVVTEVEKEAEQS